MRNYMYMCLIMIISMFVLMPGVKADYDKLVPFVEGSNTSIITNGAVSGGDFGTKDNGESVSFVVLQCDSTLATQNGSSYTFTRDDCSTGDVSYVSSDTSVVTVSNGYLTFVGSGSATITATLGGLSISYPVTVIVSSSSSTETSTQDSTINEETVIEDDEVASVPKDSSDKTKKKSNAVSGTQTSSNPSTGIAVAGIYFILFAFIAGFSVLIYRKTYQQRLGVIRK